MQKTQLKLYSYINSNGGWDAWTFEILEQEECGGHEFKRYKKALLIKQHGAKLNTTMPVPSYDIEDARRQICGNCGEEIDITKTGKRDLQRHFKLQRCINATPPIILKGKNNIAKYTYYNY